MALMGQCPPWPTTWGSQPRSGLTTLMPRRSVALLCPGLGTERVSSFKGAHRVGQEGGMPGIMLGMWGDSCSAETGGLNGMMWQTQGSHLNKKRLRWLWGLGEGAQILGWSPPDVRHSPHSPSPGWGGRSGGWWAESRAGARKGRACHGLRSGSQPYSSSASSEAPPYVWGRQSPGEKPEAAGEDPRRC